MLIGVLALVAFPLMAGAQDLPRIELRIIGHPAEVPASSSFYLRVQLVNAGAVPVRGCVIELGRVVSKNPCVTLGYRFWQAPRRLELPSVDTVPILSRQESLDPGQSIERSVRLISPRRGTTGPLHLYAIAAGPAEPVWIHETLPITVGGAPFEVRRREVVTLTLLAIYLLGIGWALVRIARGVLGGRRRACSS